MSLENNEKQQSSLMEKALPGKEAGGILQGQSRVEEMAHGDIQSRVGEMAHGDIQSQVEEMAHGDIQSRAEEMPHGTIQSREKEASCGTVPGLDRYLMDSLLLMGETLLNSGAEVFRVEDTLDRIGLSYGASHMNVFALSTFLLITIEGPDGSSMTKSRRFRNLAGDTDFTRLERLNALSRSVCRSPIPTATLYRKIWAIAFQKRRKGEMLAGYVLASAAFTVFFGGSVLDGIVAGGIGVLIWLMMLHLHPICMNSIVFEFTASFLSGFCICLLSHLLPSVQMGEIMIGDIMLLIPGILFTNSMRDILLGDTISGGMMLIHAVLLTLALTFGIATAIWCVGWLL